MRNDLNFESSTVKKKKKLSFEDFFEVIFAKGR